MFSIALLVCVVAVLLSPAGAGARKGNWVSTWLKNSSVLGNTGKGIYTVSPGGFSIRYYNTKGRIWKPISISPPGISIGCGGVDVWGGSVSFMSNWSDVVDRSKQIIESALPFAFKYALAKLCPTCEKILGDLSATANTLNQLSLDTCRASKALAVSFVNHIKPTEWGEMIAEAAKRSGDYSSWWSSFTQNVRKLESDSGKALQEIKEYISGNQAASCPAGINTLILQPGRNLTKYCNMWISLSDLLVEDGFIMNDQVSKGLLRYLRTIGGDVFIPYYSSGSGNNLTLAVYTAYPPMQEVSNIFAFAGVGNSSNFQGFYPSKEVCSDGVPEVKKDDSVDPIKDIPSWVSVRLTDIFNALEASTFDKPGSTVKLSAEDQAFLYSIAGTEAYQYLKSLYGLGIVQSVLLYSVGYSQLVKCFSTYYLHGLVMNVVMMSRMYHEFLNSLRIACSNAGSGCLYCSSRFLNNLKRAIERYDAVIGAQVARLEKEYEEAKENVCQSLPKTFTIVARLKSYVQEHTLKRLSP